MHTVTECSEAPLSLTGDKLLSSLPCPSHNERQHWGAILRTSVKSENTENLTFNHSSRTSDNCFIPKNHDCPRCLPIPIVNNNKSYLHYEDLAHTRQEAEAGPGYVLLRRPSCHR